MKAYVFSGQGSQQKGMGGGLFEEFKSLVNEADRILGYSIEDLCLYDEHQQLGQTEYTQPALYVVNALSYLKKINDTDRKPDYVAGHSLGEYNALLAAEVFDFATGLKLVKKRGELMAKARDGGMAAVIGLSEEEVGEILKDNNLHTLDIANLNTPSQIVISGPKGEIENAQSIFENSGALLYSILNVSGAFHSRYMKDSKEEFENYLSGFEFKKPMIKVISNYTARPYRSWNIKENMMEQIVHSVKWTESIRYLMGKGIQDIEQVGPGFVVIDLVNKIRREAEALIVNDEEENQKFIPIEEEIKTKEAFDNDETTSENPEIQGESKLETTLAIDLDMSTVDLGSHEFKKKYGLKYAYLSGGMHSGISSADMVIRMSKAGMLGFYGTNGLDIQTIETNIRKLRYSLNEDEPFGVNLFYNFNNPNKDEELVDLFLKNGVKIVEASSYMTITPALIRFKAKGLDGDGISRHKIIAKVSRADMAEMFLTSPSKKLLDKLVEEGTITKSQAEILSRIPIADDICVEGDSGGYTDRKSSLAILPTVIRIKNRMKQEIPAVENVSIGLAGGVGTPESAAAAFVMGADFILTASINQCTVEAGTSDVVKDILQQINVQDTDYVSAGNMLEMGNQVQVVKRGLFFHARANKLTELYRTHDSINQIDAKTISRLEEKYFKNDLNRIYEMAKKQYSATEVEKAESSPKYKMGLIFRWYFDNGTMDAIKGSLENKLDFQIQCGSALGSFNQWVKETDIENWRNRHVNEIGEKIMSGAVAVISEFNN